MNLRWITKDYSALNTDELYELLALRSNVFIVEQNCAYQDVDGKDKKSIHLFALDAQEKCVACLRLVRPGVSYAEWSIGRVATAATHRSQGLGKEVMLRGIAHLESLGVKNIRISAQSYLKIFYQNLGFRQVSEEYLEDDIPHIEMLFEKMNDIKNKEALDSRWDDLEKAKQEFLAEMDKMANSKLHTQPENGWSAIQVIEHILSSETGTLGYMLKKSSSGWDQLESTGSEHTENSVAINTRLASAEKYKAPSILPEPTNNISADELLNNWNELRVKMYSFINTIEPVNYDKLVFKQPMAGMLNILHTLEFLTHHIRHHIPQLKRISESVK